MISLQMLLAKAKLASGNLSGAAVNVQNALSLDLSNEEAHILMVFYN